MNQLTDNSDLFYILLSILIGFGFYAMYLIAERLILSKIKDQLDNQNNNIKKQEKNINSYILKFKFLKDILKIRLKNTYLSDIDTDTQTKRDMFNELINKEKQEVEEYLSKKYSKNIDRNTIIKFLNEIYS